MEGLSNPEIAETLHLKVATVKSRVTPCPALSCGRA
jgi:DNA-binding NarL/FixJ family response regulator